MNSTTKAIDKTTFSISRLNTHLGIIKVTGVWEPTPLGIVQAELQILTLDIMGTDGWVALDITRPKTLTLIDKLNSEILQHLQTR